MLVRITDHGKGHKVGIYLTDRGAVDYVNTPIEFTRLMAKIQADIPAHQENPTGRAPSMPESFLPWIAELRNRARAAGFHVGDGDFEQAFMGSGTESKKYASGKRPLPFMVAGHMVAMAYRKKLLSIEEYASREEEIARVIYVTHWNPSSSWVFHQARVGRPLPGANAAEFCDLDFWWRRADVLRTCLFQWRRLAFDVLDEDRHPWERDVLAKRTPLKA